MPALRRTLLLPENALLIGDRNMATAPNMLAFCRQRQLFLAAHPGTATTKDAWRESAARLFVSPLTSKTHVSRIMTKLNARDRAQLVVVAYETGLVTPGRR